MIEKICEPKSCTGCGTCVQKCPKGAISLLPDVEGFLQPVICNEKCIECKICLSSCPQNKETPTHEGEFIMGWHKDTDVLKDSSSGGAFTLLADYVLHKQGVVFGAVQDSETFEIHHDIAETTEEIAPMRLSKYYQSNTMSSYSDAKKCLEAGRWVLYTGTACQIAGLYSFLGKEYDKLITVDVLCHGVSSKTIIDSWVKGKEKRFKKKIVSFAFRVKDNIVGWQAGGGTRMKMVFEDGSAFVEPREEDTFMIGFNKNFFLRESCYRCKYCGTRRISDFTVGDFWGCNRAEVSEEQKKLGVSLILVNTPKAKAILEECKEDFYIQPIHSTEAIPYNRALVEPNARPKQRDWFYKAINIVTYDTVIKCIFAKRFIKRRIKKLLKMI